MHDLKTEFDASGGGNISAFVRWMLATLPDLDVNAAREEGTTNTALHLAVEGGNEVCIQELVHLPFLPYLLLSGP